MVHPGAGEKSGHQDPHCPRRGVGAPTHHGKCQCPRPGPADDADQQRAGHDRGALAFSFGPHVQFWAAKEGLEALGAMVVPLGGMTSVQRLQTLREALKLLSSGNLIRASKGPGGGIFVAHTAEQGMGRSLSDAVGMMLDTGAVSVEELLEARMLLEVPMAGAAAYNADEADLRRLREAMAHEAKAAAGGDHDALARIDQAVHRTIAAATGNRMVQALTGWMLEVLQPRLVELLRDAVVHSAIVGQHETLIAALEKGDAARAERVMKDHLLYLRDLLHIVQDGHPK